MCDGFEYSERDCLNLNIFVPALQAVPEGGVPVIVIIHGGRSRSGGSALPAFDGTNIVQASVKANRPVIVVVMNYRLGYLGYLASHELAHEFDSDPGNRTHGRTHDQDPAFGNWGLSDQRLALEWVRNRIAAFGGDPSNVTAMGYSAGATSIVSHMMIRGHRGLFSKAIVHSGPSGLVLSRFAEFHSQLMFNHLHKCFGPEAAAENAHGAPEGKTKTKREPDYTSKELLERAQAMRDLSAETFMQVPEVPGMDGFFYTQLDNKNMFPSPELLARRDPLDFDPGVKSVIIGATADEGSMFTTSHGTCSVRQWQSFLNRWVAPSEQTEVDAIYGTPMSNSEARSISARMVGDMYAGYPTSHGCQGLLGIENQERTIHRYYMDRPLKASEKFGQGLGVPHGSDMAFSLMSDLYLRYMTEEEKAFGYRMLDMYLQFVYGVENALPGQKSSGVERRSSNGLATIWAEDLSVRTGPFERLSARQMDFWKKNEEWAASRKPSRPLGSVVVRVPKNDRPDTMEYARL